MPRKRKNEDISKLLPELNRKLKQQRSDQNHIRIKEEVISLDSTDSIASGTCTLGSEDSSSVASKGKLKGEPLTKLEQLQKAHEINIQMGQLIKVEIDKVKLALKRNLEKQSVLGDVLSEDKEAKSHSKPPSNVRAISIFAAPYFRDIKRMVHPVNEDTIIKRKNHDVNAYLTPPRPWHREEHTKLLDGVTSFALLSAIKPYKIRRDHIKSKLKDKKNLTDEEVENLEKLLAEVEQDIKQASSRPLHELLDELKGNFDWMTISSVNMEGTRTPEECESLWNNFLDFSINKESFDEIEDARLKDLAEIHRERDWDKIAQSLKTCRTAVQCFERYQTRLSSNLTKRYWTPEEDKQLVDLVNSMKVGKIIPWNKVCLELEGRTRQQVINRYERSISQAYNRGPWTTEEDALLIGCIHKFGMRWAKMKPFFKRRSSYSIRERYVNALDPEIKMGSWTKDEDKLLITLIRKYGYGKWSKICKHIPGRTDNMCLVRAGRLLEHSVKFLSKNGVDIDIDTDMNDPKVFAKILRPLAPTKFLAARNSKLKSIRDNAIDTFLMVVSKIVPSFVIREADLNSYDFTFLNNDVLHRVSNELHRMLEERESNSKQPFVPNYRYLKKIPRREKQKYQTILEDESDVENDLEVYQEEVPTGLSEEESVWMHEVMAELFKMVTKVLPPSQKKSFLALNTREHAESTLFKAYLYKQFHCKAICDQEDDLENVIFSGIDYSETLQTVVSYFIQPPIYEDQFIVLAPNMTTIGGMEYMEGTEDRLKSMSELVRYSTPYMDYICERTSENPTCLQCLNKKNAHISTKVSPEIMISDMKAKHFIVTDTLEKAAYVESASHELCGEDCQCDALEKSRNSVRLLRQRFMGLFLWPALLASTKFSKQQEDILCEQSSSEIEKNYYLRMQDRGRLPGSKNKPKSSYLQATSAKRKRKQTCKVSKVGQNSGDASTKMKLPESSNAFRNTEVPVSNDLPSEASCSHNLPTAIPVSNDLPSEASCSHNLPTEIPCSNSLSTEASCSNCLPVEVPFSNGLSTEASCSHRLSSEASFSHNLPIETPCSNSLPTKASCSISLPTEVSCSYNLPPEVPCFNSLPTEASSLNSLPTEASCSYTLPIEVPSSNGVATETSCSNTLPMEASCSYRLAIPLIDFRKETPVKKKKYSKLVTTPPSETRRSKRKCVTTRKYFAFPNKSESEEWTDF